MVGFIAGRTAPRRIAMWCTISGGKGDAESKIALESIKVSPSPARIGKTLRALLSH
jgi:succinyl-CoA synthetase alpha subunit